MIKFNLRSRLPCSLKAVSYWKLVSPVLSCCCWEQNACQVKSDNRKIKSKVAKILSHKNQNQTAEKNWFSSLPVLKNCQHLEALVDMFNELGCLSNIVSHAGSLVIKRLHAHLGTCCSHKVDLLTVRCRI